MATKTKICINCTKAFLFSTSEQDFYRAHNLADPKRCYRCRQAYKRNIHPSTSESKECLGCHERLVCGVVVDAQNKCLDCGRLIEKTATQYPVLAHHLRGASDEAS